MGPSWAPFWNYVGSKLAQLTKLAPSWPQERSKRLMESSKRLPRGPKRLQEELQQTSRRPPACQDSSKSSQRCPRSGAGAILEQCWKHFGSNLTSPTAPRTYPTSLRRGLVYLDRGLMYLNLSPKYHVLSLAYLHSSLQKRPVDKACPARQPAPRWHGPPLHVD